MTTRLGLALVLTGLTSCAKTTGPAPGMAEGDEIVLTYYYLNF